MNAKPGPEHEWLRKLIGEWTFSTDCDMGPGQPPTQTSGTEIVRSLGGLWVVAEGVGGTANDPWSSLMTLGYDPARQEFVGTYVASMMTHLWTYAGILNGAGTVLTLDTVGPSFTGEGTTRYQDVHELHGDDERVLYSQAAKPDGGWHRFMVSRYRRKK